MSRRYPLDPPELESRPNGGSGQGWLSDQGLAMRLAAATAEILLDIGEWRRRHADLSRAIVGLALLGLGLLLGAAAAVTDSYLHRGVESGAEQPYIVQPTGKGLAANVDVRSYSQEQTENVANALNDAGFLYIRQEFSWSGIEPSRGDYQWTEYDRIVNEMSRMRIGVIAVIVDTPVWARAIGESGFANAPPRDATLLTAFSAELAGRYPEAVPFIQVWDRPNLSSNWGGDSATGAIFAPYLEAAWRGAKSGSAEVRVISPELAMLPDLPGGEGDLAFIDSLYAVNAASYFDLLGMSLDGDTYSPDDRRVSVDRGNFSRAILVRELMIRNDDPATPVWATSYGWAASDSVNRIEQAEFVERGMNRSWSEWPWMGLMVQWAFIAPAESPQEAYAIVDPNGSATPLYSRLTSDDLTSRSVIANTGFAPMDSQSITDAGNWQDQHLEGRTFRTTGQVGASATVEFQGTGLIAYVRSGPEVGGFTITVDGKVVSGGGGETGDVWDLSLFSETEDFPRTLVDGLDDTRHTMTITLASEGELTLGGVEVTRDAPFVWPIILMTVGAI
ncbi:MAG: beta-galactosidase, partial [Thermomicrobiales bacterium]